MLGEEAVLQLKGILREEIRDSVGSEMTKLNEAFGQLKTEIVHSLDSKVQEKVNEATQEINKNLVQLKKNDTDLEEKIKKCEKQLLEEKKRKNLIIHGLGTFQNWKERENAVFQMIREKMGIICNNEDIDAIIKLDKRRDDGPILVKFTTNRKKLDVLFNRKLLKDTSIFIDEDYSKEIVEKRKELKKIMKQLKNDGKEKVYLKQDKLFVDGILWSKEEHETGALVKEGDMDVEMANDSQEQGKKDSANKKRGRSPGSADVSGNQGRKPKKQQSLQKQQKLNKFFNRSLEPRPRSSSAGASLGPEIAKIVDKLTAKEKQPSASIGEDKGKKEEIQSGTENGSGEQRNEPSGTEEA
ncbi:uncharacterized protein LOC113469837 [Diaphorina citri]|uniref:Uncharacterized protein LOC113469837 n=1 Tax=Diaphorina citri TaxID=121845 RepID=A0A3Q0J9I5_DIACI|nr:uncharacterized protein LOC113469837 [Diaphorina citri]